MYGLTEDDLDIQKRARDLRRRADPARGSRPSWRAASCPPSVTAAPRRTGPRARAVRDEHAQELGGGGCTTLQQVLVQEQVGRVTNALAWAVSTPAVLAAARSPRPTRSNGTSCPPSAASARSATRSPRRTRGPTSTAIEATARRDGDDYLLNGDKWHVTSLQHRRLRLLPGQAGGRRARRRARDVPRRPAEPRACGWSAPRRTRTRSATTTRSSPSTDVRVPAANLVGAEGDGMTLRLRVVPVRAADGRRPLPRRGGAADRRDDGVRRHAAGRRPPDQRVRPGRRACSPTA